MWTKLGLTVGSVLNAIPFLHISNPTETLTETDTIWYFVDSWHHPTLIFLLPKSTNLSHNNQVVPDKARNMRTTNSVRGGAMRLHNDFANIPVLKTPLWLPYSLPHHLQCGQLAVHPWQRLWPIYIKAEFLAVVGVRFHFWHVSAACPPSLRLFLLHRQT